MKELIKKQTRKYFLANDSRVEARKNPTVAVADALLHVIIAILCEALNDTALCILNG